MTDQRFTELLGKELAGEISQEESVELKSILADNPAFQTEYNSLQAYFATEEEQDENIDTVYNKIRAQINVPDRAPLQKKPIIRLWLQAAAALLMIASGVLWYARQSDAPVTSTAQWSKVSTQARQMRTVVLSDGSIVKMNAVSSLKYPEKFTGKQREVYLSGEALFEVKKDAVHPFIVHTEELNVKVLGTVFVVKAYGNDDFTEATLFRGSVAVTLNAAPDSEYILKPNDKLNFTHLAAAPLISKVVPFYKKSTDGFVENGWTRHELIFRNTSFADVAKLFERWYDLKISFKEDHLKTLNFTGRFKNETETEALDALKLIESFHYGIEGKNVTIYK